MSLRAVLTRVSIDPQFSPSDADLIRGIVRSAYKDSAAAHNMLESVVNQDQTLDFTFKAGKFSARASKFKVLIDFNYLDKRAYIDENGQAIRFTPADALLHELVHAIQGLKDPKFKGYGNPGFDYAGFTDYAGDTVRKTNLIMDELGFDSNRVSYSGTGKLGKDLQKDFAYTDGKPIDIALSGVKGIFDTEANGRSTRDLFIGSSIADTMRSGLADDFLYGQKGADTLFAGEGNDKLGGGKDTDELNGGGGNDTLIGSSGIDTLSGGDGDDTYVLSPEDTVTGETGGRDTAVLSKAGSYVLSDIEVVRTEAKLTISVSVINDEVETIQFGDQGGTIDYEVGVLTERNILVEFGAGKDIFIISTELATLATGIIDEETGDQLGFFWGFTISGASAEDKIDLTDLGLAGVVGEGETLTLDQETGVYLLAPNAQVVHDPASFEDWDFDTYASREQWALLDLNVSRYSPFFPGDVESANFLI